MIDQSGETENRKSICSLIAWMSVCMLAASWGSSIPEPWRYAWADMGIFGLTSALGLNVGARYRSTRRRQYLQQLETVYFEYRLSQVMNHSETREAVRSVVARLTEDMHKREALRPKHDSEIDAKLLRHPVQVQLIDTVGMPQHGKKTELITGYLRDLSNSGVGLLHKQPLPVGHVRLTFDLLSGESISLLVDLRWCRKLDDRWHWSGGPFIDVSPYCEEKQRVSEDLLLVGSSLN